MEWFTFHTFHWQGMTKGLKSNWASLIHPVSQDFSVSDFLCFTAAFFRAELYPKGKDHVGQAGEFVIQEAQTLSPVQLGNKLASHQLTLPVMLHWGITCQMSLFFFQPGNCSSCKLFKMSSCSKEICSPQRENLLKVTSCWVLEGPWGSNQSQIGIFLSARVSCWLFGWGIVTASWGGGFLAAVHFFLKEWGVFVFFFLSLESVRSKISHSIPPATFLGGKRAVLLYEVQSCPQLSDASVSTCTFVIL